MSKKLYFFIGQFFLILLSVDGPAFGAVKDANCPDLGTNVYSKLIDKSWLKYDNTVSSSVDTSLKDVPVCESFSETGNSEKTKKAGCYKYYIAESGKSDVYGEDFSGRFKTSAPCVFGTGSSLDQNTVKKCFYLDEGASFDVVKMHNGNPADPNFTDWGLKSSAYGSTDVLYEGLAFCSETTPGYTTDSLGSISLKNTNLHAANYCWCRLVYPVATNWWNAPTSSMAPDACRTSCKDICSNTKNFKNVLRNNLFINDLLLIPDGA